MASNVEQLVSAYLDGEILPDECEALGRLLAAEPRLRRRLHGELRLHVMLRRVAREAASLAAEPGLRRPPLRRAYSRVVRRRVSVPWRTLSMAAAVLVAVGVVRFWRAGTRPGQVGSADQLGAVSACEGTVYLVRGASRVPIDVRRALRWGDRLETVGPAASASVACGDWGRLELGADTRLTFCARDVAAQADAGAERRLSIDEGFLSLAVLRGSGSTRTRVLTPGGDVLVTGTQFSVLARRGRPTRVHVTEGAVKLTAVDGGVSESVSAGYYADMGRTITPVRPRGGPVPDWLLRLGEEANAFLAKGVLDVTLYEGWKGNAVDRTGARDCTVALRRAIADARDHGLVAFFPAGVYRVSDTLACMNRARWDARRREWRSDEQGQTTVLAGSTRGRRPVIRLADRAGGFGDPANPKAVVQFWAQTPEHPKRREPPPETVSFADLQARPQAGVKQVFRGIDVEVGRANPGAVGVAFPGAQGCSLEDCRITASGGYAGLWGVPGHSMGAANLEVIGGRYGIVVPSSALCAVLAGVVLRDQTDLAIHIPSQWTPITLVGFRIVKDNAPAIELRRSRLGTPEGLVLVDGSVEVRHGGGTALSHDGRVACYVRNVYFKGVDDAVAASPKTAVHCAGEWTKVAEYARCATVPGKGEGANLIDGRVNQDPVVTVEPRAGPPPEDLVVRHVWRRQPSFEDADAKDVTDSDIGAKGDGRTDDAAALQHAIDTYDKVFLPKGTYTIGKTLILGSRTALFGPAKQHAVIQPAATWDAGPEAPLVTTRDDPAAVTHLASVTLRSHSFEDGPATSNLLTWRAGRRSLVKSLDLAPYTSSAHGTPPFRVCGNGGGRCYFWNCGFVGGGPAPESYRFFSVEGTREPFTCYGLQARQGAIGALPVVEIRNARNVRIFAVNMNSVNEMVHIRKSRNILVAGFGGHAGGKPDTAHFRVIDSEDVAVALAGSSAYDASRYVVYEQNSGGRDGFLRQDKALGLYRKGRLDDSAWTWTPPPGDERPAAREDASEDASRRASANLTGF
ncbi:MAG: FecR domain-containing protein [Kiritimatiellae bacterium]|nr:FecR domain-containing protein [Kiritimatiellia bacterium]